MRQLFSFLAAALFVACGPATQSPTPATATDSVPPATAQRIISLSGTITEVLFALDQGERVVGVDVTSTYPAATADLPKLGHVSQLNVEALLELRPDLVFVDRDAADKPALKTLADAGVEIVPVPMSPTLDNAVRVTAVLEEHLNLPATKTQQLAADVSADGRALEEALSATGPDVPRVLFIYARGAGRLLVAGTDTDAEAMIRLAGGTNAITSFADFKPLTPEALVEAAPDVLLMFTSGLASLDGKAGLANIPGIAQTRAFQQGRVVAMDGQYLMGFGPRAATAARELAEQLHQPVSR